MQILITGADGQLGRELRRDIPKTLGSVIPTDQSDLDIRSGADIAAFFGRHSPSVVINAAAFTQVDDAEKRPEDAYAINRDGPGNLAEACRKAGIPLIHISTDFVFDGETSVPYAESDPVHPLSVYGKSKAEGEEQVARHLTEHLIIRTAWLYSAWGHNFLKTMLRLMQTRETLRVVSDQQGCPTSARELAGALVGILRHLAAGASPAWGTYHFCGTGITSWHGFATEIHRLARDRMAIRTRSIQAIPTTAYPTPARRPPYSALDCTRIREAFGVVHPPWQNAVAAVVAELASPA